MEKLSVIGSAEIEADLLARYPHLDRLVSQVSYRKRALAALVKGRGKIAQAEVARRMGTTQSVIARLESGKVDPTLSTLERYASALGANFTWQIVDDEGEVVVRIDNGFGWYGWDAPDGAEVKVQERA
jgi:DNA-binding XRE family transcriptional regulator